jgi:hypothetical protein
MDIMSTQQDIEERVAKEVAALKDDDFGVAVSSLLVQPPRLISVRDSAGRVWEEWLVFQEANEGYQIVMDPDDGDYSLVHGGTTLSTFKSLRDCLLGM